MRVFPTEKCFEVCLIDPNGLIKHTKTSAPLNVNSIYELYFIDMDTKASLHVPQEDDGVANGKLQDYQINLMYF